MPSPRPVHAWGAAWLVVPLLCHAAFSWIGFSPTDEGWLQAIARRLADGQVPHRDFILVRPALSALLQVPLVWACGDHVLACARLWGWLTLGATCWIWSGLVLPDRHAGVAPRMALQLLALACSAHTFPVMAWPSLDGMLLCSLAVVLVRRGSSRSAALGFACVGLAALCRQNFALFGPLLLLAMSGPARRRVAAAAWAMLPPVLYAATVAAAGGGNDLFEQLAAAHGTLWGTAIKPYMDHFAFKLALPAGLALGLLARVRGGRAAGAASAAVFLAAALGLGSGLWRGFVPYHDAAHAAFGLALGLAAPRALAPRADAHERAVLVTGLGLAWVSGISVGYRGPLLGSGIVLLLLGRPLPAASPAARAAWLPLALALAIAVPAFVRARHRFPYNDRPSAELRWEAGRVLAGASGLRTNATTYRMLAELRRLTRAAEAAGRPYAVVTDLAAQGIRSRQANPLPCEWPQDTELGRSGALFLRWRDAVLALPPDSRIVVQRHLITEFATRVAPVPRTATHYRAQNWVLAHCPVVEQHAWFTVCRPPGRRPGLPPASPPAPRATPAPRRRTARRGPGTRARRG